MKTWLANTFVKFLGARGYRISRHVFHQEEDIDLRLLLAERIEKSKATFSVLQIGANDGKENDPIYHLVTSRGWKLLAVEPLPKAFDRLTKNYAEHPNVSCVQCAVTNINGKMDLYTLDASAEGTRDDHLASFSKEVLAKHWRHIPNLNSRIVVHPVKGVTLSTLIHESGFGEIDMLQIDTEGFDFEILKMAFSAGIRPPIIAFEWEHLDQKSMWECRCKLIEHGYRWLVIKGDVVAAHESLF